MSIHHGESATDTVAATSSINAAGLIENGRFSASTANRRTAAHNAPHFLEARLACSNDEIQLAQSLRYQVFYREMSAVADAITRHTKLDRDAFDPICDHLLVLDHQNDQPPDVVATYRLLRQSIAENHNGFYSAKEFALDPLLEKHRKLNFLELGRSCVNSSFREKRIIELLWQGTWSYIQHHKIDVLFGCASLPGTSLDGLAAELSFLHHYARAPDLWRVKAIDGLGHSMNRLNKHKIDKKSVFRALPPLLKGYLRVGAWVADEAVIDHQFGTTDVMIILPVANIRKRYLNHYNRENR